MRTWLTLRIYSSRTWAGTTETASRRPAGGPPCQSFSRANSSRVPDDPRSKLVRHFFHRAAVSPVPPSARLHTDGKCPRLRRRMAACSPAKSSGSRSTALKLGPSGQPQRIPGPRLRPHRLGRARPRRGRALLRQARRTPRPRGMDGTRRTVHVRRHRQEPGARASPRGGTAAETAGCLSRDADRPAAADFLTAPARRPTL